MKNNLLLLIVTSFLCLSLANRKSDECQLIFNVSTKLKKTHDSEDGENRVYFDVKTALNLDVSKYEINKPKASMLGFIQSFIYDKNLLEDSFSPKSGEVKYNNIEVEIYSYMQQTDKKDLIHKAFVFASESHLYKMEFSFPTKNETKCEREINQVMKSLSLDCD